MRILMVENDAALREDLGRRLTEAGYVVEVAMNRVDALHAGREYQLSAAIVGMGVPGMCGLEIVPQWREAGLCFPVIFLTASRIWRACVDAFAAGADDCLYKPFEFEELLVRMQRLLLRAHGWVTAHLVCGPITLDPRLQVVTARGEPLSLTTFEYRVLQLLMHKCGHVLSGTDICNHLYREEVDVESNMVAQLVCRLRRKLADRGITNAIETVYGGGYRFVIPRGAVGI